MSKDNSNAEAIAKVFSDYCQKKKYQIKQSEETNYVRLEISNLKDRTYVNIYHTSKIVIQGSKNTLRSEMEEMERKFDADPSSFIEDEMPKIKACVTNYDIMLTRFRGEIKQSLRSLGAVLEITENPTTATEYKAKITRHGSSLTLTQYNNGTLLLQGKTDKLFNDCCDHIEQIANPADNEVISRFISGDEESLELFTKKYSPELISSAEKNVKEKIGDVYDYLEPHDQKWFVASECLCLTEIPLPEYSPLVMPASKSFEGFAKKLLVDIRLFDPDHFKTKSATFSTLNDKTNPKRQVICDKERYAETILNKISLCLDMSRNFMMHSDDSKITKINTIEDAEKKVNGIFAETKEIFDYFNDIYNLYP